MPYGLGGDRTLLVWLKDDAFQWSAPEAVDITGATLTVEGRWCGRWYDRWAGTWLRHVTFDGSVIVPVFRRDIALRAHRC